ncbi:LIM-domain binding protein-domain-containing protein [Collybia nuda]|uniref:LIM-domain binding protein-domain-containing protein n=1 Tax=Collybia nuda TaxID=64659 RepID=A0A9P6CEG9_9AGAR|nr:LIM-domain binding protein-domain-containing protein [Collybia nuda]
MTGNLRPDMLRQGMQQSTMLMNGPSFMQNPPPPGQPQLGQNHLGMPSNPNPNAGMMMGNPGNPIHPSQQQAQQRYHMQMQPQSRGQPMMNPGGGPMPSGAAPPMPGMPHNMGFPGGMMQHPTPAVRRVSSQPQLPTSGPLAGMSPGVTNSLSMGQFMLQHHMPGQMPPEMPMSMNRQGANPGMVPGRTGSAQLMGSLPQPASLPHPMGAHLSNQFQNPPMPTQHQQPSPRAGSHTPNIPMATPGPSHTPVNRPQNQMTPDNGQMPYMNFSNSQFGQPHNNPMPNGPFGFGPGPSPPPPIPMADMPQPMPGIGTPSGTPTRPGFHLTPAQQYKQMNTSPENYSGQFMHPPNIPPRPPSHNNHHPPLPQQQQHPPQPPQQHQHHSPHHPDHMNSNPQRPPSQPQAIPRPSSQAGRQTHTPRPSQPQLPPAPPVLSSQLIFGLKRTLSLGSGQGLIRLLQFSGVLASESKTKLQLSWWNELVKEYFTPKAVMKFTLWKDNQRNEAKPFEIGVPILPRFFLVTTQSGVKSMTLTLDGARERMYAQGHAVVECVAAVWTYKYHNGYTVTLRGPLTAHVVITSTHPPGSAQASQSPPHFVLKFEDFQFDANFHDKYIALESVVGTRVVEPPKTPHLHPRNPSTPTPNSGVNQQQLEDDKKWEEPRVTIERASIPGEPVNAFGIPQATMRCLELAESVGQMADLISFSNESSLGPLEALNKFASRIREMQPFIPNPQPNMINGGMVNSHLQNNHPFTSVHGNINNVPPTPAVTLYSSAPPSVTNPSGAHSTTQSLNSPKNPPSASNSPQKQHKTIPQQNQASASSSVTAASPSVSSGTTTNTPALANASLKRKQASDVTSPTTTPDQPPQKRVTRKRGRTTTGGS